uniref:Uncharacterized protein n=1 Tax=Cucumis melo TaxID=3656 RepID=A0A9I9EJI0_CUCME
MNFNNFCSNKFSKFIVSFATAIKPPQAFPMFRKCNHNFVPDIMKEAACNKQPCPLILSACLLSTKKCLFDGVSSNALKHFLTQSSVSEVISIEKDLCDRSS